jgi:hypothetical protein
MPRQVETEVLAHPERQPAQLHDEGWIDLDQIVGVERGPRGHLARDRQQPGDIGLRPGGKLGHDANDGNDARRNEQRVEPLATRGNESSSFGGRRGRGERRL